MLIYLAIFLSTLAADFAWTKYNMHSAAKRAHPAAAWSAAIIAFGAFNVMSYTANHWLIIPALLGAYVGAWGAIWWEHHKTRILAYKPCPECFDSEGGCIHCNGH